MGEHEEQRDSYISVANRDAMAENAYDYYSFNSLRRYHLRQDGHACC